MGKLQSPSLVTLGKLIQRARDALGLTQQELADTLNYSTGWVSGIENATLRIKSESVPELEKALGLPPGTLVEIYEQARQETPHPLEAFDQFIEAEAAATDIHTYEALAAPGLLQTPEYAYALISESLPAKRPDQIEEITATRMDRQQILLRDDPPELWLVITENALRQPVGEPEVHLGQLDRLIEASEQPGITIQVIPTAAGAHAGLTSSFLIFGFSDGSRVGHSDDPARVNPHRSPELVRVLWQAYDALRAKALSEAESRSFIRQIRKELE